MESGGGSTDAPVFSARWLEAEKSIRGEGGVVYSAAEEAC